MTESRTVLQFGDIAGVAHGLDAAIGQTPNWRSTLVELPEHGASGRRLIKQALLVPRGIASAAIVTRQVAHRSPDVVHLHWARYAPFVHVRDRPLVVHAHGSDVRGLSASPSGRWVQRSLRRAALVIGSTPDLLADLPAGARYLPNPVDTDLFVPAPRAETRPTDRHPVVLVFARLTDVKGAPALLDAVRELHARRPEIVIQGIVGGTYDDRARDLGVQLLGPLDRAGVIRALQAADVIIGQQHLGSLGLAELEAMSCARPVVVSVPDSMYGIEPPVIASTGAASIADQCCRLLDDPALRSAVGGRARDHIVEHHALGTIGALLTSWYEELL